MGKPSQPKRRLAFEKEWPRHATAQPGCRDFMVVCGHLTPDFNNGQSIPNPTKDLHHAAL
ncbi:hypothetical protein C2W62_11995 [Candidatus Entotheonella serta]|nr:hypothetical protein C2W62_11995 [Candidatus Entotheonella serta]